MRVRRRLILVSIVGVVAFLAVAYGVVHLPGVQRRVWDRVALSVEEETGWRIQVRELALRGLPARFVATGITVSTDEGELIAIDRLQADWRWRALRGTPHRLDRVVLDGVDVDINAFAQQEQQADEANAELDLWNSFEVGEIALNGGRIDSSLLEFECGLEGVVVQGSMEHGTAATDLSAQRLFIVRDGRFLDFQALSLRAHAAADGARIDQLAVQGTAVSLEVSGQTALALEGPGRVEIGLDADLEAVADWWDPNIVTGLSPKGRLEARGYADLKPSTGLEFELVHQGEALEVAGYELAELGVAFRGGTPSLWTSDPSWGTVHVDVIGGASAAIAADFHDAPIDRLLSFLAPQVAAEIRGPVLLSGTVDGNLSYPLSHQTLDGAVDLGVSWAEGRVALRGRGGGNGWQVSRMSALTAGIEFEANGRVELGGEVEADVNLAVVDLRQTMTALTRWFPAAGDLEVSGGPLKATGRLSGLLGDPVLKAQLDWTEPVVAGRPLARCTVEVEGKIENPDFSALVRVDPQVLITADGTIQPLAGSAAGRWRVEAAEIRGAVARVAPEILQPVFGQIAGGGTFDVSGPLYRLGGSVRAQDVGFGEWKAEVVETDIELEPGVARLDGLKVEALGGVIAGAVTFPFEDLEQFFRVDLEWSGLRTGLLPYSIPESALGVVSGKAGIGGRASHPVGEVDLAWSPESPDFPVGRIGVHAALADGELRALSEEITTSGGTVRAEVIAPLGDLPLPDWLWPDAPSRGLCGRLPRHSASVSNRFSRPSASRMSMLT